jgi:hypothetical protein
LVVERKRCRSGARLVERDGKYIPVVRWAAQQIRFSPLTESWHNDWRWCCLLSHITQARDRFSVYDDLEYPMVVLDGEPALMIKATKEPGEGQRRVAGSLADDTRESWDVAISFVAINAKRLRAWATGAAVGTCHANLYTDKEDLTLSVGNLSGPKNGSSAGACAALSLLKVLAPIKLVGELVAVTGTLDLRGRVGPVGGIKEKLSTIYNKRYSVFVVPQETHDEILEARETEVGMEEASVRLMAMMCPCPSSPCLHRCSSCWLVVADQEWDPVLLEAADKLMKPAATFIDVMELAVRGKKGGSRYCPNRGDDMLSSVISCHVEEEIDRCIGGYAGL